MSVEELICRFCLKIPQDDATTVDETTKNLFDMLQIKVNLSMNENPIICNVCSETIKKLFTFQSLCNSRTDVNLRDIYNSMEIDTILKRHSDICGLCLKPATSESMIAINSLQNDSNMKDLWTEYMTNVSLNITINSKICHQCKDNIECYSKFALNIINTEEKIHIYRNTLKDQSQKQILLSNLVKYLQSDALVLQNSIQKTSSFQNCLNEKYKPEVNDYMEIVINNELMIKETDTIECKEINKLNVLTTEGLTEHERCSCGNCQACIQNYNMFIEDIPHDIADFSQKHKCPCCNYHTDRNETFKAHLSKHREWEFHCTDCEYKTYRKYNLEKHIQTHINKNMRKKSHSCAQCSYSTKRKCDLERHAASHNTSKTYECTECDFKTNRKDSLTRHSVTHMDKSGMETYKCEKCAYKTYMKKYLQSHVQLHHEPKLACASCSFRTNRKKLLERHNLIHEISKKGMMYECTLCHVKIKEESEFIKHSRAHEDKLRPKVFECPECSYATWKKSQLAYHSVVHKSITEVETYKCVRCTYETKYKRNLCKHATTHEKREGLKKNMH